MLEQQAVVTRIIDRRVYVKSLQTSACGHCLQRESCATTYYADLLPNREMALPCNLPVQAGDKVIVGVEESHLLRASLMMYLLPLLLMLGVVGLSGGDEQTTVLLVIATLSISFYVLHRLQNELVHYIIAPPRILRKI